MANKSAISEILEVKARSQRGHRSMALLELHALEKELGRTDWNKSEIANYFPIRLCTITEVFFRSSVAALIDLGSPYLGRASKLVKNNLFDLESVLALSGKQVSLGEFIASQVKFGSLDRIIGVMRSLLERDYPAELMSIRSDMPLGMWDETASGDPLIDDLDGMCRNVQRMIEVRHILIHEIPDKPVFAVDEIRGFYDAVYLLIRTTDALVWNVVDPYAPKTGNEAQQKARFDAKFAEDEVNEAVKMLKAHLTEKRIKMLDEVQDTWRRYVELDANLEADKFEGGTIMPVIYLISLRRASEARRDQLRRMIESEKEW